MIHTVTSWEEHTTRSGAKFLRRLTMVEGDHAGHEDWEYSCPVCGRYLGSSASTARSHDRKHKT
jgi:hypothetical protein